MSKLTVAITRLPNGRDIDLPAYATEGAAGMDLYAAIAEPVTLSSLERRVIPCGFALALPPGHEAQIRARSGLALKQGLTVANGVGTIDADYRGEVGAILVNLSPDPVTITPGMRVAQMVIAKHEIAEWQEVDELPQTARGAGGFGSTGTGKAA